MAKWSTSDTGILRKKNQKEKHEDLLVFGYACKLFRDDEKALSIDQGKHLIPWMGNESLRIDRYDGRGALSELAPYESSKEGYDTMRWLGLSESERKLEQLCDEERYYALHANEDEENMYKEEEAKRNQQKDKEFQYNYDVAPNPDAVQTPMVEEEDKPFVPPPELDVPADIEIPKTVKENTRIEKTAIFVSKQGPQMEILIKAKQADNPQFNFMNQNDPLYKYYRHILSAIKNGRYKIVDNKQEKSTEDKEMEGSEDHYLHPSLLTSSTALGRTVVQPMPQINYKPSADCAYSQLVNRIQGNQTESTVGLKTTPLPPSTSGSQMTYEQQQYYQYYYTMQYYEYYKQMAQYQGQNFSQSENSEGLISQQIQEHFTNQLAQAQYMKQQNPYAQIVTNIKDNTQQKSGAITEADSGKTDISKAPVIYGPSNLDTTTFIGPQKPDLISKEPETAKEIKEITFVQNVPKPLVHYATDSEVSESECEAEPPPDIKIIICKMASYVTKNGSDFEAIVKSKGDPRFQFLNKDHEFHSYYKAKIREYTRDKSPLDEEIRQVTVEKEQAPKIKEKKIIAPVSFSIKKPKEHEVPKEIKSALPVEESDEEVDDKNEPQNAVQDQEQQQQQLVEKESPKSELKNGIMDVDDPILEMIDLTDDAEEKRDAKRAEDRIKDKLAAAAREKLASASRDRALQLERKKRAAAFLKLKSAESDVSQKDEVEIRSVTVIGEDKIHTISDSDNNSKDETGKLSKRSDKKEREHKEPECNDRSDKHRRKASKKRKSDKSKRSKSKHDYRHKKSKKRRRRSESYSSASCEST